LNATSVVIEGSSASSGGARINVDLSHIQTTTKLPYSLFPGQIVALEGMNVTGRKLTAHRIVEGAPPPCHTTSVRELRDFYYSSEKQDGKPIKVVTACGPFTTSDSMDYQPFVDLLHVVMEQAPDVVILTGPFVDLRHPAIQSGGSITIDVGDEEEAIEMAVPYETVFAQKISALLEELLMPPEDEGDGVTTSNNNTQFVLVPALEDATAKWV
jgi:DNA polymerase alpha subunit B